MRLTDNEVKIITETTQSIFGKTSIYLFGSRLDNTKKGGDIDLFLIPELTTNLLQKKIKVASKLERLLYKPVDIVVHKDFSRPIEQEILQSNIQLHTKKQTQI